MEKICSKITIKLPCKNDPGPEAVRSFHGKLDSNSLEIGWHEKMFALVCVWIIWQRVGH